MPPEGVRTPTPTDELSAEAAAADRVGDDRPWASAATARAPPTPRPRRRQSVPPDARNAPALAARRASAGANAPSTPWPDRPRTAAPECRKGQVRRGEDPLVPGPLVRHVHHGAAHHRAGLRRLAPDVQHEALDRRDSVAAAQRPPEDHVRGQGLTEQGRRIAVVRGFERGDERVDRRARRLFLRAPVIPAVARAPVPRAAFRSRWTIPVTAAPIASGPTGRTLPARTAPARAAAGSASSRTRPTRHATARSPAPAAAAALRPDRLPRTPRGLVRRQPSQETSRCRHPLRASPPSVTRRPCRSQPCASGREQPPRNGPQTTSNSFPSGSCMAAA
ncbi:hypothetical protein HEP81_00337 [Streptomyces griseofuscus]|uniref:Uncharacterized protein n=1 Tax=Streptomyces griseofuscus TaxID=146922 RepID=A0A7H1PRJ4_9ACTN|nr:hypothetical protein HEP81_00337 [Streptomyces griseofuscus]